AVVTGGSRGIGAMIAAGLLEAGAKVYLCSRKEQELSATAASLGELGEVDSFAADLSGADGVKALVDYVGARQERLDLLFNNAGATWGAPLEDFPEAGGLGSAARCIITGAPPIAPNRRLRRRRA